MQNQFQDLENDGPNR